MDAYEKETFALEEKRNIWPRFLKMLSLINIPWLLVVCNMAIALISTKLGVIFPDYQRRFFNGDIALRTILIGIGILIISEIVKLINTYTEGYVRNIISKNFRDKVFDKTMRLSLRNFDKISPKELISRTTVDTQEIGEFIVTVFVTLVSGVYGIWLNLSLVYGYNHKLVLMELLIIPLFIFEKFIQGRIDFKLQYKMLSRLSSLTEFLSDLLVNIPVIKIFVREKTEENRGERYIDRYNAIKFKSGWIGVIFGVVEQILLIGNRVFAVLYGAMLVHRGEIDIAHG